MGPVETKSGALKAAINVTPLVDVVLVLLIIFMVVTPMLSQSGELSLPMAVSAEPSSAQQVTVEIEKSGALRVSGKRVQEAELTARVRAGAAMQGTGVLLRADGNVPVRRIRQVLRTLRDGGIQQVAFAVREKP